MTADRLVKVNELIKQLAGELVLREVDFGKDVLVTVTRVETSRDLRYSKVLITVFPNDRERNVLEVLEKEIFGIQRMLNKKLNMRPIPKIHFEIDRVEKEAARIEELLAQVKEEN